MSEEKITDLVENAFKTTEVIIDVLTKIKELDVIGCITVAGNVLEYVINRFELNEKEVIKMMREVSKEIEEMFGNIVDCVEEF